MHLYRIDIMAFPFMSAREVNLMRSDFEQNLLSAEAINVTLQYYVQLNANGEVSTDPILKHNVRAMQKPIKLRDLQNLKDRILEVGDCIFYFSTSLNLNEPVLDSPMAQGTLKVIDPSGLVWSPRVIDGGEASRFLTFHTMNFQLGQALICKLEK